MVAARNITPPLRLVDPNDHTPDDHDPDDLNFYDLDPDDHAPDDHAPDDHAPDDHAPDDHAPDDHAPNDHAPNDHAEEPGATLNDDLFRHEAITRKVPNPLIDGAGPATPPPIEAARSAKLPLLRRFDAKWLALAGVATFAIAAGVVALRRTSGKPVVTTPSPGPAPAAAPPQPAPSPVPFPPTPVVALVPTNVPSLATSHIEILVQPSDATLALDGSTAGGNQIKADVPRDWGQHVVVALAPGYEPFKKIISFANDLYLEIELKRKPAPVRGGAKTRPAQNQVEEFGRSPERPETRRPAKKIDENDPYAP